MSKNPVVHFEMGYFDNERMKKFYETTFGWQLQQMGAEMGNYENQNRVTLTDLMSNWWSKHPVGPLAPLGWDAVADCEYQGEQGILVKNHITGVYAMYRSGGIRDLPQGEVIAALITLGER